VGVVLGELGELGVGGTEVGRREEEEVVVVVVVLRGGTEVAIVVEWMEVEASVGGM